MSDHFDVAVVGSGPGGYVAALKAAQLGARVAVVEKGPLGGTCLNAGCIPSKALLYSAEMLHHLRSAERWGLVVPGPVSFDWAAIQKRKDRVIRQLRGGIGALFKGREVALVQGRARLEGPGRIAVQAEGSAPRTLRARKVILATGSLPSRIPGWPDDPQRICTSDEAVHWKDLPRRLLIVGGGVIGCEFACMMQAYGVEVRVVEMLPELLPGLDHDLGAELLRIFTARGIACHLGAKVEGLELGETGVKATLQPATGAALQIEAERVLVATGRRPNTGELGLETVGLQTSPKGFLQVNERMQTAAQDYYCIGDANGRCLLAHAASAHGVAAAENALGEGRPFAEPIPSAVYTFPEIGSVGLTEREALAQKLPIAVGRFPIGHLGKAMAISQQDGFVKTIRQRESGALLGVHLLGHNATEIIAAATPFLRLKVSLRELAETVFAHPTIGEALKESAEDALGMGLHLPPRKILRAMAGSL